MHEPVANNPYSILIEECHNDEKQIQARYSAHRNSREIDQRVKVLSSDFPGVSIDPILRGLLDERARRQNVNLANIPRRESVRFHDERHNLVFWIRPPTHIRDLIVQCQAKLKEAIPHFYFLAPADLHMTVFEIIHSTTAENVDMLLTALRPVVQDMLDTPTKPQCRTRLVAPMLVFDAAAVALSFLPAVTDGDQPYTYHHLRRDMCMTASEVVEVQSRYVVPSAHLTVGRFVSDEDTQGPEAMEKFVGTIDLINEWLRNEYWPGRAKFGLGGWMVAEERGMHLRVGTCWYGDGGRTVTTGKNL